MACNAWNHSATCNCGWGGVSYGFVAETTPPPDRREVSFLNPNARCPACGDQVFFYRSPNGGAVYFDGLGWPWPKHPCMDIDGGASTRTISPPVHSEFSSARSEKLDDQDAAQWTPFEIVSVVQEHTYTLLVGRVDYATSMIKIGVQSLVNTERGIPAFIRAKPERRGMIDLSTLSDLDPIEIDAYLDCIEGDDLRAWNAALSGSPADLNMVGWRMCFGRDRAQPSARNEFTRPNWLGGFYWFCQAALAGYASALNNLASAKLLKGCGVGETEWAALQERLYASASLLEKSREHAPGGLASTLAEVREVVDEMRHKVATIR